MVQKKKTKTRIMYVKFMGEVSNRKTNNNRK